MGLDPPSANPDHPAAGQDPPYGFLYPQALSTSPLGRALLAGMAIFWLIRLATRFIWLRVDHPLVHALSVLFATGAILFALPLLA